MRQRLAIVAGIVVVLLMTWFGAGLPGLDLGRSASVDVEPKALGPSAFAARVADDDVVILDVRKGGSDGIEGTDLRIAADEVEDGDDRLPVGRGVAILVYGDATGDAAAVARLLAGAGRADVAYLEGGFGAWVGAGLRVEPIDG